MEIEISSVGARERKRVGRRRKVGRRKERREMGMRVRPGKVGGGVEMFASAALQSVLKLLVPVSTLGLD
jgi:hypothetical protein